MILKGASRAPLIKMVIYGVIIGLVFAAILGSAYNMSGDARLCGSCHSMKLVHQRWGVSNHHQFACAECHLPDANIFRQAAYKTKAGINDLLHETTRDYSTVIGLSARARQIINSNCFRCHAATIANTPLAKSGGNCLKCHRYLVHGRSVDIGGIKVE